MSSETAADTAESWQTHSAIPRQGGSSPSPRSEQTAGRRERGEQRMREVLGEHSDTVLRSLHDVAPDLGRFIVDFAYGEVHARSGLDHRQRSLVAISVVSSIGGCDDALRLHVHGGLNVGLRPEEIVETVLQCAVYAGFPRALTAMAQVRTVFRERGLLPLESAKPVG